MMPIVDKYSEMGTVVIGKVESGHCEKGQNLSIYPNRTDVKVDQLWSDDIEVTKVTCGENVKVKLKGVDEAGITPGFVLCDPQNPIKSCRTFDAKVCTYLGTIMYISLIFFSQGSKTKGDFFSESAMCFSKLQISKRIYIPKKYPELEI